MLAAGLKSVTLHLQSLRRHARAMAMVQASRQQPGSAINLGLHPHRTMSFAARVERVAHSGHPTTG